MIRDIRKLKKAIHHAGLHMEWHNDESYTIRSGNWDYVCALVIDAQECGFIVYKKTDYGPIALCKSTAKTALSTIKKLTNDEI